MTTLNPTYIPTTTIMNSIQQKPRLEACQKFSELTRPSKLLNYAKGAPLDQLAELASIAIDYHKNNLMRDLKGRTEDISTIKQSLGTAIDLKRQYYDHNFLGIITKIILKLLWQWNNGDTAAIVAAEDVLLRWDSRWRLEKITKPENPNFGKYYEQPPHILDASVTSFYNYTPKRAIPLDSGTNFPFNRS